MVRTAIVQINTNVHVLSQYLRFEKPNFSRPVKVPRNLFTEPNLAREPMSGQPTISGHWREICRSNSELLLANVRPQCHPLCCLYRLSVPLEALVNERAFERVMWWEQRQRDEWWMRDGQRRIIYTFTIDCRAVQFGSALCGGGAGGRQSSNEIESYS